ncbi:MAG: chromate efflux transporter, partial [Wenzhouxiangella sp.]
MDNSPKISWPDALGVWFRVAMLSFGGPAAQIGVMQRLIVEEKRWLDQDRFNHALNFCMLLPGPEAQQLATYIGWLLQGVRGGLLAGIVFILPGALIMLALSLLYVTVGEARLIEGLLFGLKCAVLAIVIQALLRMAGKVVKGLGGLVLAGLAFAAMFLFNLPFPLVILGAGLAGLVLYARTPPVAASATHRAGTNWPVVLATTAAWLVPVGILFAWLGMDSVWSRVAGFFSLMSVLSFGGAYAVLAWVAQYAAETREWITAAEMLDGLGLAETTPGPLILVTQFVGFLATWRHDTLLNPLLAGSLGALLTTWVMFAPSFLWIFLFAPQVEKLRGNARIAGALKGITAAVVGVIANLGLWFGLRLLFADSQELTLGPMAIEWPVVASLSLP